MKKIIFLVLLSAIISPALMAQKRINPNRIPEAVYSDLKIKFPSVTKIKWKTVDSLFFGSFMLNGKGYDVTYKMKGPWVETMSEIDIKDLPDAVVKGVNKLYTSAIIKAAAKVEEASKKISYIVTLRFKGKRVEMTLDALGNQIS